MRQSRFGILGLSALLGMFSHTSVSVSAASRPYGLIKRTYTTRPRNNLAGSKIARKAANGVLTLRHPSGIVAQTFREMQQRNFKETRHGI